MAFVINCGEQDIEGNGICISISIKKSSTDTQEIIFAHIVDSLLGISEFIADCEYSFAQVNFDCEMDKIDLKDYFDFTNFINLPKNEELKRILSKYVVYEENETVIDDGAVWYSFILENSKKSMTEDDTVNFVSIFKGIVNE